VFLFEDDGRPNPDFFRWVSGMAGRGKRSLESRRGYAYDVAGWIDFLRDAYETDYVEELPNMRCWSSWAHGPWRAQLLEAACTDTHHQSGPACDTRYPDPACFPATFQSGRASPVPAAGSYGPRSNPLSLLC